jgi:tRNA (adenine57-N1/adenine58-N1)-methyltransferase
LVELARGRSFHSHSGLIRHDDLIGGTVGGWYRTSGGTPLLGIRPRPMDYVLKMRRLAQVVYPKDFGAIVGRMGIRPGFEVLEVGLGSGALTIALLLAAGPKGRVVSVEMRQDHADRASQNIRRFFGTSPLEHRIVIGDATRCIRGDEAFDAAVIDVAEPWRVLEAITPLIRSGSFVACFSPSTAQVSETTEAFEALQYGMVETVEVFERGWYVRGKAIRPEHRMVAHTGFVTVGCKTSRRDPA